MIIRKTNSKSYHIGYLLATYGHLFIPGRDESAY